MLISIVLPAFNEAGNIGRLVAETLKAVPQGQLGEIIVVDDCSDDSTGTEVKALASVESRVRYLRHDRRAGQSAALRSGISAARFPIIATMDGDGQNDPADIAGLLALLAAPGTEGPALVGGVRAKRRAAGSRRFASIAANRIRDFVLADGCPDTGCGIKVFWRETFVRLPYFSGMHRYLPALFITYGRDVAYAPVSDRPRVAGQSKYTNFGRALIGIYDLVGVSWLRRRTMVPMIAEDSEPAIPLRTGIVQPTENVGTENLVRENVTVGAT